MEPARGAQRVSAAEFIRGFGNWRLQAARKPVVVTHHGKDAHVLISLADYRRLGAAGGEGGDPLLASQAALLETLRDAIILIDPRRRVRAVNPAAADMLERAAGELVGGALDDILPALDGSMIQAHLQRMLDHRERFSGEVPGLIRPRCWLRIDLVPLPVGGAIVMRDTSDIWDAQDEQDSRRALADAIETDGSIGVARLSVRERVEAANPALATMIGADETAMRRVRFSALLTSGARQAFADAIETLFRSGAPMRIASELITREGGALPVHLAMVERRSAYASEGATVLVTRR